MEASIANRLPNNPIPRGGDDLYQKYCRFTEEARRQVVIEYPPGPDRDHLLKIWEPVHKERFEAKLEEFEKTPRKLEKILYLLERGLRAS